MEDKLTSSSDKLFANVLNNILSDNCNLVKNLIFLLWTASETEQLKLKLIKLYKLNVIRDQTYVDLSCNLNEIIHNMLIFFHLVYTL